MLTKVLKDRTTLFEKEKERVQAKALAWVQREIGKICKKNKWDLHCLYWTVLSFNGVEIHDKFNKDSRTIFELLSWYEQYFCPCGEQMICDKGKWR